MAKKVKLGQQVRFDPFEEVMGWGIESLRHEVTGTVVEIYPKHKWFSVDYGNPKQRISFKFCDVGKSVNIVG